MRASRWTIEPPSLIFVASLSLFGCSPDMLGEGTSLADRGPATEGASTPRGSMEEAPANAELRAAYLASVQRAAPPSYRLVRDQSAGFAGVNLAQGLRVELLERGARVVTEGGAGKRFDVAWRSWGCEGALVPMSSATPSEDDGRIVYRRGGLTEWYQNGPLGLEQGFSIEEAPRCTGVKVVDLRVEGDLRPHLVRAGMGDEVVLRDEEGADVLRYTDLVVQDALGRRVSAWMSAEDDAIRIHVDDAGAAYPIEVDPLIWVQQGKLVAADATTGQLAGQSVAISGDTAIVGANGDASQGGYTGAAYVFVRSNGVWVQQAKLLASDAAMGDNFGHAVAISGDTALVGAVGDDIVYANQGSVYVFTRSNGVWAEQAKLVATDGEAVDQFGVSAALSGDTAIVGVERDDDNGALAGSAYVFVRSGSSWSQQAKLLASDGAVNDYFGGSVSLFGNTALIGAWGDDVGVATDAGSAYVFVRNGTTWSQQTKLVAADGAAGDSFGMSISLDTNTAIVGARNDDDKGTDSGSAYVFTTNGASWSQQSKLVAADGGANDWFGNAVTIAGDVVVVGSKLDDDKGGNAGAAYVFARNGGTWVQQTKVLASDGISGDVLGYSAAMSGDTVVLGAQGADAAGVDSNSGAAYVYRLAKANGDACLAHSECLSGFCTDGVCCNSTCGNGAAGDCQACSVAAGASMNGTCAPLAAGTVCRASGGACDAIESCNGVATTCPADNVATVGTTCRSSAGACDPSETCDGQSKACPPDSKAAAETECRSSAGQCDPSESCDGISAACPTDAKLPAGMECRPAAGPCDAPEACDGTTPSCPADTKLAAGTTCNPASSSLCDAPEVCNGASDECPTEDAKLPAGTPCRAAVDACDAPELCDGTSKDCPTDDWLPAGWPCRPSAGDCDVSETCNGTSPQCPSDTLASPGIVCRKAAGPCDAPETCDGASIDCPADRLSSQGMPCRLADGPCDIAEQCDGVTVSCPLDQLVPDGLACNEAGICTSGTCVDSTPPIHEAGACVCGVGAPRPDRSAPFFAGTIALSLLTWTRRRRRARARSPLVRE